MVAEMVGQRGGTSLGFQIRIRITKPLRASARPEANRLRQRNAGAFANGYAKSGMAQRTYGGKPVYIRSVRYEDTPVIIHVRAPRTHLAADASAVLPENYPPEGIVTFHSLC